MYMCGKTLLGMCSSTDSIKLKGQEDSFERAHSTNPQQARGGAERQSWGACDSLMLLPTPLPPSSTK